MLVCTAVSFLSIVGIMASQMRSISYDSSSTRVYMDTTPIPQLNEGDVLIKVWGGGKYLWIILIIFFALARFVLLVSIAWTLFKWLESILHLQEIQKFLEWRVCNMTLILGVECQNAGCTKCIFLFSLSLSFRGGKSVEFPGQGEDQPERRRWSNGFSGGRRLCR